MADRGPQSPRLPEGLNKELDVRPLLQAGIEPFEEIMRFVDQLGPGEGFRLWATFRPDPLLAVMARRGFRAEPWALPDGSWAVDFLPAEDGAAGR
ncbi:MAG: DUF2249 domain-containing protein [Firmicutes bacterium]|nr:DUF2249 domain-containing protein [Alicyclobacillaceae bacterium]MCL6496731.1 DUF2249 domain-containing protein [Bacillota bacterium]